MVMRLDEEFIDTSFSSSKLQAMLPVENEIVIEKLVFSYPGGKSFSIILQNIFLQKK
jgi:hypothetical protein